MCGIFDNLLILKFFYLEIEIQISQIQGVTE